MIHLVRSSEGKKGKRYLGFSTSEVLRLQITKFLNAWGKIISAETLLDENMFVACMERLHLSQIYQGTSVQVLIAFNGIVFLLVKL